LSNFFPFSERSGLNVISEFNSDNVTLYKDDESEELDDKMEVEEEAEVRLFEGMNIQIPGLDKVIAQCQEQKKNNLKLDYNMYIKFWSLQDYLRNPVQCYNKVNWKTFALVRF
jgi:THO complex subunit 1